MQYVNLLTDKTAWHIHLHDFNEELDRIIAMHKYLVTVSEVQFEAEYERLLSERGGEDYDGGDAVWDAEKSLGINPWSVASHAGLMAVTRAISLSEVTLARMAASLLKDPEYWVFPKGQLWFREWEGHFFDSVPLEPMKVEGNGFGTLRGLRDLYTHGYGIPTTESRRTKLARKLYSQFDTSPLKSEEEALGYSGSAYFFGEETEFSPKTQALVKQTFMPTRADISPLATYRVLKRIREHIERIHAALAKGLRPEAELTASENKFVAAVEAWWARNSPNNANDGR